MDSTNIYEYIVNTNKNHKLIPSPYYASIEDAIEKITNNVIGKGNHILLSTGSATPTYYYYVLYQAENEEYYITTIPDEYKPNDYMKIEDGCYW